MPGSGVTRTISYGLRLMHLMVLYSLTNINTAKIFFDVCHVFHIGSISDVVYLRGQFNDRRSFSQKPFVCSDGSRPTNISEHY